MLFLFLFKFMKTIYIKIKNVMSIRVKGLKYYFVENWNENFKLFKK